MEYKNLSIIGTSHIAKQSVEDVKSFITNKKPDIVALELDKGRYYALTSKNKKGVGFKGIFKVGFKGFLFSMIGAWAEKKLGDYVGMSPGAEMQQAIRLAKKENIKLALIDQDIEITLKRFSQTLSWKEKWNFIVDLFNGFILRKKEIEFDLRTVPQKDLIKKLLEKVKLRYPNIYLVLIEERNIVMAKNLSMIISRNPDKRILAIVGAGHEEELVELIKKNDNHISYSYSIG